MSAFGIGDPRKDEWLSDPDFLRWANEAVLADTVPKIEGSFATIALINGAKGESDVKQAVELGFTLMMDKPLILLVLAGAYVPTRLAKAADAILDVTDLSSKETQKMITAAINAIDS